MTWKGGQLRWSKDEPVTSYILDRRTGVTQCAIFGRLLAL